VLARDGRHIAGDSKDAGHEPNRSFCTFTLILTFPCRAVNYDVENEPQASSASRRAALILSRLKPKATHAGIGNSTIIVRFG
jgi:hypothetical protein